MTYTDAELIEYHSGMYEYQENIKPLLVTLKELCDIWDIGSTSTAAYILKRLHSAGMVDAIKKGSRTYYYAKPT
jgi:hypothetical protein